MSNPSKIRFGADEDDQENSSSSGLDDQSDPEQPLVFATTDLSDADNLQPPSPTSGINAPTTTIASSPSFPGTSSSSLGFGTSIGYGTAAAPARAPYPPTPAPPNPPIPSPLTGGGSAPGRTLIENDEVPVTDGDFKVGILGPTGSGKTYLFQAIAYRLENAGKYGALTPFIEPNRVFLWESTKPGPKAHEWGLDEFNRRYRKWDRLDKTLYGEFHWYRLHADYRTGWIKGKRRTLELSFVDCSGEFLEDGQNANVAGPMDAKEIWRQGFHDARVIVFCFPMWAAFPGPEMNAAPQANWDRFEQFVDGFSKILDHFNREIRNCRIRPRVVLALTWADDRRSGLTRLSESWIHPYMNMPDHYLSCLSTSSGVVRYLSNARAVSDYVQKEFEQSGHPRLRALVKKMNFGGGKPWLIPITAIDGHLLDNPSERMPGKEPVPAHVELPLLLALCEKHNALM